jgi:hypothetical protein
VCRGIGRWGWHTRKGIRREPIIVALDINADFGLYRWR